MRGGVATRRVGGGDVDAFAKNLRDVAQQAGPILASITTSTGNVASADTPQSAAISRSAADA
jgi:hypothetical protein